MHKILNHTSDLEIEVGADNFGNLVKESIFAITEFVCKNIQPVEIKTLKIKVENFEQTLIDVLEEVIYLQSAESFYVNGVTLKINNKILELELFGGKGDVKDEIKAVTWHDLKVSEKKAHFICDL